MIGQVPSQLCDYLAAHAYWAQEFQAGEFADAATARGVMTSEANCVEFFSPDGVLASAGLCRLGFLVTARILYRVSSRVLKRRMHS